MKTAYIYGIMKIQSNIRSASSHGFVSIFVISLKEKHNPKYNATHKESIKIYLINISFRKTHWSVLNKEKETKKETKLNISKVIYNN